MRRIAEKVSTVQGDLGSVNPVIDAQIQEHFGSLAPKRVGSRSVDSDAAITKAMSGELALDASLTELARTYAGRKVAMHLTPASARRVVDTALTLSAQPTLVEVGDQDTDAAVFQVGSLGPRWQNAIAGLDTRLNVGVPRPITFDDTAAKGRTDLVHIHLGHALLQKSARILRNTLFGSDSRVHRVTAVVVDDIPESCVAAVSRLVLVGRGGLRLHEEVFLTGIRLRGQAMAEGKVDVVLDRALDATDLALATEPIRAGLAQEWSAEGSHLRERLEQAMRARAALKQERVGAQLDARRDGDIERARQIFAAFRANLTDSLARLQAAEDEQLMMLPLPDDQQRQRQRDIRAMQERLLTLRDEEEREVAGIRDRYADVQPYVSAAAVVFALTPADAAARGGIR